MRIAYTTVNHPALRIQPGGWGALLRARRECPKPVEMGGFRGVGGASVAQFARPGVPPMGMSMEAPTQNLRSELLPSNTVREWNP
jgi:hypothetical protein